MLEQDIKITATRILQEVSHIKGIMHEGQLMQLVIALTFLRRIDCLIEAFADESSKFYSANKNKLSDERLDTKLREISGGYPFYNVSGYTIHGILVSNDSIEVVLNSYLQGFSANVLEFLDGMDFRMNISVLQRQSKYLVDILKVYSKLDLSNSSIDNEEFINLIMSLTSWNIEHSTPNSISSFISECLLAKDIRSLKDEHSKISIYDPVCGTGCMLAIAGEIAKRIVVHQDNISLNGQEIQMASSGIAKALILLSGNQFSKIQYGNTLTDDMFIGNSFQYILADFPMGMMWRPIKERIERESFEPNGRFSIGLPSISDSQFLFIEHIISKMDVEGSRAAFLTNSTVLYGGNSSSGESRIRRWLFENDLVETIIALPRKTLTITNIPVYLWILTNKKDDKQKGHVCLIDLTVKEDEGRQVVIGHDFFKSALELYRSWGNSTLSTVIKNEKFGFYEVGLLENGKKKETIRIPLDCDLESFIEKEIQPFSKGKVTPDYSSVEKGYSVDFSNFFKSDDDKITSLDESTNEILSTINAITSLKPFVKGIRNLKQGMPNDGNWKELPLRSAVEIVFGLNKPAVLSKEGLPILSVPYLRNSSDDNMYEVTPKTRCATQKDVLVIVKGANTGEVFKGVDGILSPSLAAIKCTNESIITPRYLYYLLKGYEKSFVSMAKGTTIKSIDTKMIPDFKCLIPSIEEQMRICEYLDSFVNNIDSVIGAIRVDNSIFSAFRQTLIENITHGFIRVPEK